MLMIENKKIGTEFNSVNARDLHSFIQAKQQFSDWIKNRISKYGFIENQDYTVELIKKVGNNATLKEYHITLDMAKELAMLENNQKGKEARRYFINIEKKYIKALDTAKKLMAGGYKSQIAQHNNKIARLEQELSLHKNMPVPANTYAIASINLEEKIKHLLHSTNEELKKTNENSWTFFQHRANTLVEYIKFLQTGGNEAQQFMINTINKISEQRRQSDEKYINLKDNFERFKASIEQMVQQANDIKKEF